jgi:surface carbohydrate biosynthesis protein (TIGR04326 family)
LRVSDTAVTVWDGEGTAPKAARVYLWKGYAGSGGQRSLFAYCEEHAVRLRDRYCRWVSDLGRADTGGVALVERLRSADGFSFWWMSLIVEKSALKSPEVNDAIRLLALDELLEREPPTALRLVSADYRLHAVLREYCRHAGIGYSRVARLRRPSLRALYHRVPHAVRALVTLARYVHTHWGLRGLDRSGWRAGPQARFFCSYFFNFSEDEAERGRFHSRYWEGLHALMRELRLEPNWLHLYEPVQAVPDRPRTRRWTAAFNARPAEEGFHGVLDAYLTWRLLARATARWVAISAASLRFGISREAFRPSGARVTLWPLMRYAWRSSLRGSAAMQNLIWLELFDAALRDLPRQSQGYFLCENQSWERAFVHAWRKYGHGELTAVPHSTRSFWDLRFFRDPGLAPEEAPPQANRTVMNGELARGEFLREHYDVSALVDGEALRYADVALAGHRAARVRAAGEPLELIVLGDYVASAMTCMLELLAAALRETRTSMRVTLKPHPRLATFRVRHSALAMDVVTEPLPRIIGRFDLAYCSNMTSGAVDAFLAGIPVLVALMEDELNYSPLRGHAGVRFVATARELASELDQAGAGACGAYARRNFFYLDAEFPRWRKLLAG